MGLGIWEPPCFDGASNVGPNAAEQKPKATVIRQQYVADAVILEILVRPTKKNGIRSW